MPHRLLVMGPSGTGKTTLGRALADALKVDFIEGDDLHPPENVAKMRRGEPLTDADRWPWLARIADTIVTHKRNNSSAVITCSALKRIYRDRLREADPALLFVALTAPRAVLESRLKARTAHFMPATLVESQIAAFEPPGTDENAITLDATQPIDALVAKVLAALR